MIVGAQTMLRFPTVFFAIFSATVGLHVASLDIISTVERNETIVYIELEGNDIDGNLEDDIMSILGPREEEYDQRSSASSYDRRSSVSSQASSAMNLKRVGEAKRISRARGPDLNSLMIRVRDDDPNLLDLNLSNMNIGSREDAPSLFEALASNTHLRSVNLSRNNIDDDCVSSISIALIENKSIIRLNLSINDINSEGAEYLIGALDSNQTIRQIDLRGNSIDHEILDELDEILKERRGDDHSLAPSLVSLDLNRIMTGLARNDEDLIEVRLDGVDMDAAEMEALVEALGTNTSVMSLSLNNTKFDDTLMAALSLSLVDNTKLENLSLRNNQITSEGIEYLLGTLHTNETLACELIVLIRLCAGGRESHHSFQMSMSRGIKLTIIIWTNCRHFSLHVKALTMSTLLISLNVRGQMMLV